MQTNFSKAYSSRSNARRAAIKHGIEVPEIVEVGGGFAFVYVAEPVRVAEGVLVEAQTEQLFPVEVVEAEPEVESPAKPNPFAGLINQVIKANEQGEPEKRKKKQSTQVVQNGVRRPKDGGKCAEVWAELDKIHATRMPTMNDVKQLATDKGWNPNNASCEFYCWRKFNGINRTNAK